MVLGTDSGIIEHWKYDHRWCQNDNIESFGTPISALFLSSSGSKLVVGLDQSTDGVKIFDSN